MSTTITPTPTPGRIVWANPAPIAHVSASGKASRRSLFGTQQAPLACWGCPGPGTSMAQQQRAAKKARNVRRHKRHVRGAR